MGWLFIQSRFTCSHIYTADFTIKIFVTGQYIYWLYTACIAGVNHWHQLALCLHLLWFEHKILPKLLQWTTEIYFRMEKWPSFIEQTTARADKGDLKTFSTGADEISIFTFLRGAKPTVIHFSLLFGNKISFTKIERCSSARGSVVHGWWQNCRLPARAVNGTSKNFTMLRGPSFCWRHYAK